MMNRFLKKAIKKPPFTDWRGIAFIQAVGWLLIRIGQQVVCYGDSVEIRSKNTTFKKKCRCWFIIFVGKINFAFLDFRRGLNKKPMFCRICNHSIDYLVWVRVVLLRNEQLNGLIASQSYRFPILWERMIKDSLMPSIHLQSADISL